AAGTGSVVLTWTAAAGAIVAAGGVAAFSPVPAPLVLALAAAAAAMAAGRSPAARSALSAAGRPETPVADSSTSSPAAGRPDTSVAGAGPATGRSGTSARVDAGRPERRDPKVVAARLGLLWAALAGLAPVLGVAAVAALHSGDRVRAGVGVLTELGL